MDRWALLGGQGGGRAAVELPGSRQVLTHDLLAPAGLVVHDASLWRRGLSAALFYGPS